MACRLRRAVDCRGRGGGRGGARGVRGACFASHLAVSVHYLKRTRIAPTVAFCALHLHPLLFCQIGLKHIIQFQ